MRKITDDFAAGYRAALADIDQLSESLGQGRLIGLTSRLEELIASRHKPADKPAEDKP